MNVAIYLIEDENFKVEFRLKKCRDFCASKGFIVSIVCIEDVSIDYPIEDRPKFNKLLDQVDMICVWKLETISKNSKDIEEIYYQLNKNYNIEFMTCIEQIITNTNFGKFTMNIIASVNDFIINRKKTLLEYKLEEINDFSKI